MITKIDPPDYRNASTVQVDSDAANIRLAMDEIETWAVENGMVRTHESFLRPLMAGGRRQFRGVCYRISEEERVAMKLDHQAMIERAEKLRGFYSYSAGDRE